MADEPRFEPPTTEFAPGSYGDYDGATFYGPPRWGWFWTDALGVSSTYLDPLFSAILDRCLRTGIERPLPRLVEEWNLLTGWRDVAKTIEISTVDGIDLADALEQLTAEDVAPYRASCEIADCLRCAVTLREFITSRLQVGQLFIEDF